jgi:hypothetical protein
MRMYRSILAGACVALAFGCGDDTDTDTDTIIPAPDAADPEPSADAGSPEPLPDAGTTKSCDGAAMELGTGLRSFRPVADGDTVYLYRGPQGGYMIYLSVRVRGLDPDDVTLCYEEKLTATGKRFGEGCWKVMLTNDLGDGRFERVGVWGQVDTYYWTRPGALRGEDARVDVTVTDSKGCSVTDGWSVHISDDPGT